MPIIGIAGKMMSGKSTVANYIAFRFRNTQPLVVGFSYAIKGLNISRDGLLSYFPQKSLIARSNLQRLGAFARKIDPEIWIKSVDSLYQQNVSNTFIINDVRYRNEVEWIKKQQGVVIYLMPLISYTDDLPQHIIAHDSEQFDPNWADKVILYETINEAKHKTLDYIRRIYPNLIPNDPFPIPLYLGLNISNRKNWRKVASDKTEFLQSYTQDDGKKVFEVVNNLLNATADDIVLYSLMRVIDAHAGLFYFDAPSFGGMTEIIALALRQKPVAIVSESKTVAENEFVNFFAKVFTSETEAINYIINYYGG